MLNVKSWSAKQQLILAETQPCMTEPYMVNMWVPLLQMPPEELATDFCSQNCIIKKEEEEKIVHEWLRHKNEVGMLKKSFGGE